MGEAAAMALLLLVIIMAVVYVLFKFSKKWVYYRT